MFSLSKTTITTAQAQTLVAAAFGSAAHIHTFTELADGFFNAAYAITLTDGLQTVLKIAPPPTVRVLRYERNLMAAEVAALRLVKQQTSVPVPIVYAYDDACQHLPSPSFFMSFVPGTPYHRLRSALTPATQGQIDHTTGQYLRQMNDLIGPVFGYGTPDGWRESSWKKAFGRMLDDVLMDGEEAGVLLPRPYPVLRQQLHQLAPALDEVTAPHFVHWDLWDGNIFVDPDTQAITGLIDFERALWGDPLMEAQFRTWQAGSAVDQGYGRSLFATPAAQQRRLLYNIYLYLIMIIECTYRQYATPDQENWTRPQLDHDLERLDDYLAGNKKRLSRVDEVIA